MLICWPVRLFFMNICHSLGFAGPLPREREPSLLENFPQLNSPKRARNEDPPPKHLLLMERKRLSPPPTQWCKTFVVRTSYLYLTKQVPLKRWRHCPFHRPHHSSWCQVARTRSAGRCCPPPCSPCHFQLCSSPSSPPACCSPDLPPSSCSRSLTWTTSPPPEIEHITRSHE